MCAARFKSCHKQKDHSPLETDWARSHTGKVDKSFYGLCYSFCPKEFMRLLQHVFGVLKSQFLGGTPVIQPNVAHMFKRQLYLVSECFHDKENNLFMDGQALSPIKVSNIFPETVYELLPGYACFLL